MNTRCVGKDQFGGELRFVDARTLLGWPARMVVFHHAGPCFLWGTRKVAGLYLSISDGALAVYIFFALSGFVLSIGLIRYGDRRVVLDLALRRYPRLVIPILASSLLAAALMTTGAMFNGPASTLAGSKWLGSFYGFEPSFWDATGRSLVGIFLDSRAGIYNDVFWTMFYEMLGSMLLFAWLFLAGPSRPMRLVGHGLFIALTWSARSPILAIALGAALAELRQNGWHERFQASWQGQAFAWAILATTLAFAATRADPNDRLLLALCSAGVLYAVLLSQPLQRALSGVVSQWLGRVSFSLYLVHLLVICSAGSALYMALRESSATPGAISAIAFISIVLFSLVVARCFYPVELFAVKLARFMSRLVLRRVPPLASPAW